MTHTQIKYKDSFLTKLIMSVFIIFLTFISINSLFTYFYFGKVLKEENLKKDYQVLRESGQYLATTFQEITTVAQNMLFDEQIQQFCTMDNPDYFAIENISEVLTRYTSIRHTIHSVYLKSSNASVWNIYPYDTSIETALNALDDRNFLGYSPIYSIKTGNNSQELISYRSLIHDLNNPNRIIGDLIINIDVDRLKQFFDGWNQDDSQLSLFADNNVVIASNNGINEKMLQQCNYEQLFQEDIFELEDGSLLSVSITNTPYELVTFRTDVSLHRKALPLIPFFTLTGLLLIVIVIIIVYQRLDTLTFPIKQLAQGMGEFASGNMKTKVSIQTNDEMQYLGDTFNAMVQDIDELMVKSIEDEKMKKKIKFDMMISKIHPHFIYNTLNSIIVMARKEGNQDVIEMTRSLILILQDSMSIHDDLLFDTISREKSVIEAYVTIQNYRYKNKINICFDIDDSLMEQKIAKNILQPLVENAIFHGLVPKPSKGKITVSIHNINNRCRIVVEDDGVGMNSELVESLMKGSQALKLSRKDKDSVHSIALINVMERLEFLYGDTLLFKVESKLGEGTRFIIEFELGKELHYEA